MSETNTAETEQLTNEETTEQEDKQDNEKENDKKQDRKNPMHYPQLFILHAIIVVIMIWLLFGVFFGLMTAPNNDMYPRIDSGDLLMYYKLDTDPKAQDIVVIRKNNTNYVGRVVAVGGDTVEVTDSEQLKINGNTVVENNIFKKTPRYEGFVKYPLKLADKTYFVLADSRTNAEDSRYFGPVSQSEIMGTVITVMRRTNL